MITILAGEGGLNAEPLVLTNLLGQQSSVSIKKVGLDEGRLDVSGLFSGIYFLILNNTALQFYKQKKDD